MVLHILSCSLVRVNGGQITLRRGASDVCNEMKLVQMVTAREKGSSMQNLAQNAADAPHINSVCIFSIRDDNLRGAVPSGCDVGGEINRFIRVYPREAKVAYFEVTVAVDEDVGRF